MRRISAHRSRGASCEKPSHTRRTSTKRRPAAAAVAQASAKSSVISSVKTLARCASGTSRVFFQGPAVLLLIGLARWGMVSDASGSGEGGVAAARDAQPVEDVGDAGGVRDTV